MDTTEARDKAALLCVPDIYRQTERGINYSEWVRSGRGGEGVIHWSVWLIGGLGQRGEKTTAVGRMGLFQRGSLTLAEVWQPLHFSHLFLRAAASWIHYANFCLTSKRSQHTIKVWNSTLKGQFTQITKRYIMLYLEIVQASRFARTLRKTYYMCNHILSN